MRFLNKLTKLTDGFMLIALVMMCIVAAIQVFMRFVFNYPLVWSEELARYIFVWIAFIGAGYGVRYHIHICLEFFYDRFPRLLQKIITVITNAVSIFCFAGLGICGTQFAVSQNSIASSAMGIPMSWVFIALPLGCVLMVFYLIMDTIYIFRPAILAKEAGSKC
jgi:TRAP-type C4-dicarboxylate transport system permease small subunit